MLAAHGAISPLWCMFGWNIFINVCAGTLTFKDNAAGNVQSAKNTQHKGKNRSRPGVE